MTPSPVNPAESFQQTREWRRQENEKRRVTPGASKAGTFAVSAVASGGGGGGGGGGGESRTATVTGSIPAGGGGQA